MPTLRDQEALDKATFIRLARWKSPRPTRYYERNSPESLRTASERAFRARSDAEAVSALTALEGVGLRTASALLQWMRPDQFPILDFRVVSSLGLPQPGSWEDIRFYMQVADQVRSMATTLDVDLRTLDRGLWAWNKCQA